MKRIEERIQILEDKLHAFTQFLNCITEDNRAYLVYDIDDDLKNRILELIDTFHELEGSEEGEEWRL